MIIHVIDGEYYMVARKYEIYFECEQDILKTAKENLHGKYVFMYNHTWFLIG